MAKILVVDDEEHIRLLYGEELSEIGHEVITADSGFKILERIATEKPHLIILDIKMVDYDGFEVLEDIRKSGYRDLPVLLCTAYDTFKEDIRNSQADGYVIKSFDLTELMIKIAQILPPDQLPSIAKMKTYIHSEIIQYIDRTKGTSSFDFQPNESDLNALAPHIMVAISKKAGSNAQESLTVDDLLKDFRKLVTVFHKELRKAHRLIREGFIKNGLPKHVSKLHPQELYYGNTNWVVLRSSKFVEEAIRVKEELIQEREWLEQQMKEALKRLMKGKISEIPFEDLKAILTFSAANDESDFHPLDLMIADIRHDLLGTISRIRGNQRLGDFELEKDIKALEGLYNRLVDIKGFKTSLSITSFDLIDSIKNQFHELGLFEHERIAVIIAPQEPVFITTDKSLVNLATRQVIRNAVEAIEERGTIKVAISDKREFIELEINDTGQGIPDSLLSRVFEPHFSYNKEDATGMGLTLAKMAINRLGGELRIESNQGQGTIVTITFPRGVSHDEEISDSDS